MGKVYIGIAVYKGGSVSQTGSNKTAADAFIVLKKCFPQAEQHGVICVESKLIPDNPESANIPTLKLD